MVSLAIIKPIAKTPAINAAKAFQTSFIRYKKGVGAALTFSLKDFILAVGVLSAIVDNIPVMFAVITMRPEMSIDQWLLVTLTTGVGGSLLSIGSAAGVALMGQARGYYTFFGHLKWTPVIFLGYVASIYVHVVMSGLPW